MGASTTACGSAVRAGAPLAACQDSEFSDCNRLFIKPLEESPDVPSCRLPLSL